MSSAQDFDAVAGRYERDALVQRAASEILFDLLQIGPQEAVLDLGCGSGGLTRRIRSLTAGRILGVDPSPAMIAEASAAQTDPNLRFEVCRAEDLAASEEFDIRKLRRGISSRACPAEPARGVR
jgi:ubiquinone/menaquinone biosynthesis C-methylase UbiE